MSGGATIDTPNAASLWHRLRHTRLRDALRGRIDGRLDLNQVVRAAELPTALSDLVHETARRTRLWRTEKVEVARELLAHFLDGLDAGAPPEELVRLFGDPRRAARLIRRAKKRGRPIAWKALATFVRSFAALIGLLIVLYLGLAIRVHTGSPKLARDYLAELNAPVLAMPEEQRAWPLYREALLDVGDVPRHDALHPGDEQWPELAAFAEKHAAAIPVLHEAAQKPHLGRLHWAGEHELDLPDAEGNLRDESVALRQSSDADVPFIAVALPELRYLRKAAQMLLIDAQLAAQAGDGERVCENLESVLRVAEHAAETPALISDLVTLAISSQHSDVVCRLLHEHGEVFRDEQLVRISHELAGFRGGGRLRVSFEGERWTFEDIIQRLYTDDGAGNGHLTEDAPALLNSLMSGEGAVEHSVSSSLIAPGLCALMVDRREMLRQYDEFMTMFEAEAQRPLWERQGSKADREMNRLLETRLLKFRYLLLAVMMPSLSRTSVHGELATLRRDATLTVIACELYRRREGCWPSSLAELTPRYLPSTPIDRFDGEPLRYRLVDGRPLLYSIGGDFDDDGGVVPDTQLGRWKIRDWRVGYRPEFRQELDASDLPDGDWVFWPPMD